MDLVDIRARFVRQDLAAKLGEFLVRVMALHTHRIVLGDQFMHAAEFLGRSDDMGVMTGRTGEVVLQILRMHALGDLGFDPEGFLGMAFVALQGFGFLADLLGDVRIGQEGTDVASLAGHVAMIRCSEFWRDAVRFVCRLG